MSQTIYTVTVKMVSWGAPAAITAGASSPVMTIIDTKEYKDIGKIDVIPGHQPILVLKDKENHVRLLQAITYSTIIEATSEEGPEILKPEFVMMPGSDRIH